jgi:hypothetical protein
MFNRKLCLDQYANYVCSHAIKFLRPTRSITYNSSSFGPYNFMHCFNSVKAWVSICRLICFFSNKADNIRKDTENVCYSQFHLSGFSRIYDWILECLTLITLYSRRSYTVDLFLPDILRTTWTVTLSRILLWTVTMSQITLFVVPPPNLFGTCAFFL